MVKIDQEAVFRGWDSSSGNPVVCIGPEQPHHTILTKLSPVITPVGKGYLTDEGINRQDEIVEAIKMTRRFPFARGVQALGGGLEGNAYKVILPETGNTFVVKKINRIGNSIVRLVGIPRPSKRIISQAALMHITQDTDTRIKSPQPYGYLSGKVFRYEVMQHAPGSTFISFPFGLIHTDFFMFKKNLAKLQNWIDGHFFSRKGTLINDLNPNNILRKKSDNGSIFWLIDQ